VLATNYGWRGRRAQRVGAVALLLVFLIVALFMRERAVDRARAVRCHGAGSGPRALGAPSGPAIDGLLIGEVADVLAFVATFFICGLDERASSERT
jgi:hypothetical protein